jgi:hypothetical protein
MINRKFVVASFAVLLALTFVMPIIPAQAAPTVKITFAYSGLTNINWGTVVLTINGQNYAWNNLPVSFN